MTGAVLAASVSSRSRMLGLDLKHRAADLGYSVAKDLWGRGLVPEAAKALIDWGFQSFTIEKVFACADARDRQFVRVMEKCGMRQEALLRKSRHFRGEQVDEILCGLLREEWVQRRHREAGSWAFYSEAAI